MTVSVTDLGALMRAPGGGPADPVAFTTVVDPVFTIGPKVHGGALQVVTAHAAVAAVERPEMVPVAISSDYLRAPEPREVAVVATVVKRGRRVCLVDVVVTQDGRDAVRSVVTLAEPDHGAPRHSGVPAALAAMPPEPTSDAVPVRDSPIADIVHLAAAVDMSYDRSSVPVLTGERGAPETRFWARPVDGDPDGFFAILGCDLSMPVVMNLGLLGWAPTLQMTTYLRRHPAPGWLRARTTSSEIGQGWFEEDHLIIDSTGAVVAQSRQLALIPDTAERPQEEQG
ncbi:thioesterase family protein [Williamsia deligens]|uniref:Thioesterase family protein n=1 Tax=Williamsia deligens TaxID=321325 RepID=A0ABW3G7F7_9NOCA|nr:thioesterase family protein [Williamsia deligens]MCP2194429.1 Thioesterase-like superfamily protein [Williamsia deligens]